MNPQMMQSIMQLLSNQGFSGGMGASGEFSTDPSADLSQQLQIGQPLSGQMSGGMSGMGGQMPGMQMPGGIPGMSGIGGMMNNARSGTNAIRANQGHSSFMSPHDPMSMLNALMQG